MLILKIFFRCSVSLFEEKESYSHFDLFLQFVLDV